MSRRFLILLLSGLMVLAAGGIAAAARSSGHAPSSTHGKSGQAPKSDEANEAGEHEAVHGGSVARVHDGCELPDGVSLSGNWTHGDYVSAWVKGDPTTAHDAAHSACGKPTAAGALAGAKGKSAEHRPTSPGTELAPVPAPAHP